jgi:hypothetical protein
VETIRESEHHRSHGKGNPKAQQNPFPAIITSYQRAPKSETAPLKKLRSSAETQLQISRIELDGNESAEEINKHPTQSSNHPNADVATLRESKYPKILLLPTISVVKKK